MAERTPFLSVVMPTHNRREVLRRTLGALAQQAYGGVFEVIVVADGCYDGTADLVRGQTFPVPLYLVEQAGEGPAAARNAGAAQATGQVLVFVDDDIEVAPGFLAAHARAAGPDRVVLGYLPTVLSTQDSLFRAHLRMWWERMFESMRAPNHLFTYKNLLTGNCSVDRELFNRLGGFDVRLRAHEDYELGLRLLDAGVQFVFAPDAWGWHHEKTDAARSLVRKRDEGRADVLLARRYPELMPSLPFAQSVRSRRYRAIRRLLFQNPRWAMAATRLGRWLLPVLEAARLRRHWSALLSMLQFAWYWRGVTEELRSREALAQLLQSAASPSGAVLPLDLGEGLSAAADRVDQARPRRVAVWYGSRFIGELTTPPGGERLRGVHLRPMIQEHLGWSLMSALLADPRVNDPRIPLLQRFSAGGASSLDERNT